MQSAGGFRFGTGRIGFDTAMNMQVGTSEAMNVSTTPSTTLALARLTSSRPLTHAPRGGVVDRFALVDADTNAAHVWSATPDSAATTSSATFIGTPDAVLLGTKRLVVDRLGQRVPSGGTLTETDTIVQAATVADRFALASRSFVTNGGGAIARVANDTDSALMRPIQHTERRCSTALTPPRAMHMTVPRPGAGDAILAELVVAPRASRTYLAAYAVDDARACVDAHALAIAIGCPEDETRVPQRLDCVYDDDPSSTLVRVRMPRTGACEVRAGGFIERTAFRALAAEWGSTHSKSMRRWTGPVSTRLSHEETWTTSHAGTCLICLPQCDRSIAYALVAVPGSPSCADAMGLTHVCTALAHAGVTSIVVEPGTVTPDMPEITGALTLGDLRETASMYELMRMTGLNGSEPHVVKRFDIATMLQNVCPALQRLSSTLRNSDVARARADMPAALRLSVPNDQPACGYEMRFVVPRTVLSLPAVHARSIQTGSLAIVDVSTVSGAYTVRFGAALARIDPSTGSVTLDLGGLRAVGSTSVFDRADIVIASTDSRTHLILRPVASSGTCVALALDAPNAFDPALSAGEISSDDATSLVSVRGSVRFRGYARENTLVSEWSMAPGDEHTLEIPSGFAIQDTAHVARLEFVDTQITVTAGAATRTFAGTNEWVVSQSTDNIHLRNVGASTTSVRLYLVPSMGVVRAPCIATTAPFALRLPAFIDAFKVTPRSAIRPIGDIVASGSYGISLNTVRTHFTIVARCEHVGTEHVIASTPISPGAVVEFAVDVHTLRAAGLLSESGVPVMVSIAHRFDTDTLLHCDANVCVRAASEGPMMRVVDTAGRGYVHDIDHRSVRISN